MKEDTASNAFAALAHRLRLRTFRLLMEAGPGGLPAGEIAATLGAPASTLSSHLAQLERAGLIRAQRAGQRIFYAVDTDGTRALIGFLVQDCCHGRPELCGYADSTTTVAEADGSGIREAPETA
jgi:DNA-binding transcriptional ArsR family regulator